MSTEMIWQTCSIGPADTEHLGELLGKILDSNEVIELSSDLGGGKTTFVKGLARGLGSKDIVSSPTFTISRIYNCKNDMRIEHYDFYRLHEAGIVADELAESLHDKNVITVVEWSDVVQDVLPKDRLTIEFKAVADNPDERSIVIKYPEAKQDLIKTLETAWEGTRT
jgi:tRNA threonylcarbamoyladenosine biosynthesis protein TsaE